MVVGNCRKFYIGAVLRLPLVKILRNLKFAIQLRILVPLKIMSHSENDNCSMIVLQYQERITTNDPPLFFTTLGQVGDLTIFSKLHRISPTRGRCSDVVKGFAGQHAEIHTFLLDSTDATNTVGQSWPTCNRSRSYTRPTLYTIVKSGQRDLDFRRNANAKKFINKRSESKGQCGTIANCSRPEVAQGVIFAQLKLWKNYIAHRWPVSVSQFMGFSCLPTCSKHAVNKISSEVSFAVSFFFL